MLYFSLLHLCGCWQVKIIFGLTGHKLRLCSSKDGTNELTNLKESDVLKLHASTVFAVSERWHWLHHSVMFSVMHLFCSILRGTVGIFCSHWAGLRVATDVSSMMKIGRLCNDNFDLYLIFTTVKLVFATEHNNVLFITLRRFGLFLLVKFHIYLSPCVDAGP